MSHPSSTLTIRAEIAAKIGNFGRVMAAIGAAGAEVGGVDIVRSSATSVIRDITVAVRDDDHAGEVERTIAALDGVRVLRATDRAGLAHTGGKLTMRNRAELTSRDDLSMAYTPGVARVCMAIHHDPERTWDLTIRGNSVAVIGDGSDVGGNGALGALAALPSSEAKCLYLREMGAVDGFPLPLDIHDAASIVDVVAKITSVFGGVHLADTAAPLAAEVQTLLGSALDIPVLHEEADAVAAAIVAGALNALSLAGTEPSAATAAVSGDHPAAAAVRRLLTLAGIGAADASADIAVGFGAAPEPGGAFTCAIGAGGEIPGGPVVATDRADLPNHVDPALAYPGLWRGALDCHARTLTDEMLLAAARAIAATAGGALTADNVLPSVLNAALAAAVADAVRAAAVAGGVARVTVSA